MKLSLKQLIFFLSFCFSLLIALLLILSSFYLINDELGVHFRAFLTQVNSPEDFASKFEQLHYQILLGMLWDNLLIILFLIPVLLLLSTLSVKLIFKKVITVVDAVTKRDAKNLEPIVMQGLPVEFSTLVESINTLLKQLKENLEQEKRFSADAAHELRTPLAALKIQSEVALHAKDEATRKQALQNIILGVNRSTHLIEQLLTLNRLIKGVDVDLGLRPINLVEVVSDIISLLVPAAIEKNIEVELNALQEETFVTANLGLLCVLIRNLVDNAIRYTDENGHVKVIVTEEKNHIILQVIDDGPGIPENLRSRVFERFYRIIGKQASGSGLGLAITCEIAAIFNATIKLDHVEKEKGLLVTVKFPRI